MSRRRRPRIHRPGAVLAAAVAVQFTSRDAVPEPIDDDRERAAWRAVWSTP